MQSRFIPAVALILAAQTGGQVFDPRQAGTHFEDPEGRAWTAAVHVLPDGSTQRRYTDENKEIWVESGFDSPDRMGLEKFGNPFVTSSIAKAVPPETELWPESVLIHPDGSTEIRFRDVPYGQEWMRLTSRGSSFAVPVFTLDANGAERPGVWFETGEGAPCGQSMVVPDRLRYQYRFVAEGGPIWTLETARCILSHPPCGPGVAFMLPRTDLVWVLHNGSDTSPGQEIPRGSVGTPNLGRGGQLVNIFTVTGAEAMPAASLPAMAAVEARFNRLLSSPTNLGNGNVRVNVEVRWRDIPPDSRNEIPGVLPFQNPKAFTMIDVLGTSLNRLRTTQLGPTYLAEDQAGLIDARERLLLDTNFPTASDIWARVGPGVYPAAPGAFTGTLERIGDGIGEIVIPAGQVGFFENRPQLIEVFIDSTVPWDWTTADGIDPLTCDFEAVLTHEMGHVLGFFSNADAPSDFDRMTILDLFRFDGRDLTDLGTGARFVGSDNSWPRVVVASSAPATALGRLSTDFFAMSRGDNGAQNSTDNIIPPGDARQASHWRDDGYGGGYIGVMDPDGFNGAPGNTPILPNYLSAADIRALDMIGWHIDFGGNDTPADIFTLADPAPGVMPIAGAVDVAIPPTFVWEVPSPNPGDLPGVSLVVYADAMGPNDPNGADVIFRVDGLTASSFTLPAGIVQPGETYSWVTVTFNPWSWSRSGPYTFTTVGSSCLADTNNDGIVSPQDFSAWIAAFNTQAPACDQNNDGLCLSNDFASWIQNYNAGCP